MAQEEAAERGADGVVKLTSNELSFGPLPEAEVALAEALPRANRYPDRHAAFLREAVAAANPGTDPAKNVLVGNGSSEVLLNLLQLVERPRSEEHTSELQSRQYLVCRLLLENKKGFNRNITC